MKREFYPLELTDKRERETFVRVLAKSTWRVKVNTVIAIIAVIVNCALIMSIPTSLGESYYYFNSTYIVAYIPFLGPSIGDRLIPVFGHRFDFKSAFHINYLIMMVLVLLAGTGWFAKSNQEYKDTVKLFYFVQSVSILLGFVKMITMGMIGYIGEYNSNHILTAFLIIVPIAMILPQQIHQKIIDENYRTTLREKTRRKRRILSIIMIKISSIAIMLSYLGIERLI